jgi:hypothetical protein
MNRRPVPIAARALVTAALLAASAFLTGASSAQAPSRAEILPASSVRPGMVGVGYSVFQGTRIDTFSVSILGVLRDYRPGGTLILARTANPYLEKTGIIAGMSGSPVYVDGRLIGAISYTWGFLKEPMAGITPIEEMLDILPGPAGRPGSRDDLELGSIPDAEGGASSPGEERWARAGGLPPALGDQGIRPIATPVSLSGFTDEALRYLEPWFRERGMVAVPGGAPTGAVSCDSLVAGSAVGVQLVRGDWNAAGIGTVTYRDRGRILAFGHPFTSMGWVDFPMTGAEITTVMVSAQISNKVGSATQPCGTLVADRVPGIAGEIGASPAMIPLRVAIRGSGGRERLYRFEVVRSRLLTPGLVAGVAISSISGALNDVGLCTVRYSFTTYWNGGTKVGSRSDAILSSAPVSGVGEEIAQSLTLLLGEAFRPSRLDSAVVTVDVEEGLDAMALTGIRPSTLEAAPGDSIQIEATFLRPGQGTETRRFGIRIPPSAPEGDLTLRVCDGTETNRWEQGRAPQLYQPRTLDELLALYRDERRSDHLYVQLYAEAPGAVVGRKELPQAPRSVLSVLGVDEKKPGGSSIKGATLAEREYDLRRVVNGCETVTISVSADHRR